MKIWITMRKNSFPLLRITALLLLSHGSITPTWMANNHCFSVQSITLTFQKGNVTRSRLQIRIIFFLVTALPICILSLASSEKKSKERFLKLSWPRKCTTALTAEMMLINSLNTWQNKNKQTTEYDFPLNTVNSFHIKNNFFWNHRLFICLDLRILL